MLDQILFFLNLCVREEHLQILMKNVYDAKNADNGIKHVINEYEKLKTERNI